MRKGPIALGSCLNALGYDKKVVRLAHQAMRILMCMLMLMDHLSFFVLHSKRLNCDLNSDLIHEYDRAYQCFAYAVRLCGRSDPSPSPSPSPSVLAARVSAPMFT